MNKSKLKLIMFLILSMSCCLGFANNVMPGRNIIVNQVHFDHVVWNGIPISIQVPVGQERIVKFPGSVAFKNEDARLTTDKVTIMQNNGYFYITAKQSFSSIRLHFVIRKTGESVLVDLSARQYASNSPIEVVSALSQGNQQATETKVKPQAINYVSLLRYAIQNLYSPKRLVEKQHGISRTPMYTTRSIDLFDSDGVVSMPLISWQGGKLYVTAILLKNVWARKIILDPRKVSGSWLAASFYPTNYVTPKGTKHDRTTIFLVSDQPFNSALNAVRGYIR